MESCWCCDGPRPHGTDAPSTFHRTVCQRPPHSRHQLSAHPGWLLPLPLPLHCQSGLRSYPSLIPLHCTANQSRCSRSRRPYTCFTTFLLFRPLGWQWKGKDELPWRCSCRRIPPFQKKIAEHLSMNGARPLCCTMPEITDLQALSSVHCANQNPPRVWRPVMLSCRFLNSPADSVTFLQISWSEFFFLFFFSFFYVTWSCCTIIPTWDTHPEIFTIFERKKTTKNKKKKRLENSQPRRIKST